LGGETSGNSVAQTISTVAGQVYRLEFDWGSEYGWGTYRQVQIGSTSAILLDSADVTSTWLQHHAVIDFVGNGSDRLSRWKATECRTAATRSPSCCRGWGLGVWRAGF